MRKKITMLMASLFLCMGAWAQVEEGKAYYLKVSGSETYIDTQNAIADNQNKSTIGISSTPVATYFQANTDGTWKISIDETLTGGFLAVDEWCATPNQTTGADWTIEEAADGGYYLTQSEYQGGGSADRKYLGGSNFAVGNKIYTDNYQAAAIKIEFVEASAVSLVDVTYTFTYNGVETGYTQTTTVAVGSAFPDVTVTLPFGVVAGAKPEETVTEATTREIALSINLPFEYAESYDAVETGQYWYYLVFDSNNKFYLHHDAGQDHIDLASKAVDKANKDMYSWGFVGNPFDGFQVVNRAAGSSMILSSSTTMAGTTGSDTWPIMTATPVSEGNNETWVLTASTHATNGFYMAQDGYPANRLNNRGKLAYWTGGAGSGSTFVVEARPMGPVAELEALVEEAKTLQTTVTENISTTIGDYSQETADALSAAITTAEAKGDAATADDVTALQDAIDAVSVILPTVGKYYQFHSSLAFTDGGTKAVYSNGSAPGWKTVDTNDKSFYWQAVETDYGVALQNVADSKYLVGNATQSGAWTMATEPSAASAIDVKTFSKEGDNYEYGVVLNGWQMHCNGHSDGAGTASNIVSWNTDAAGSASSWYIVEVELPTFYTITYNFQFEGETKYTQTAELAPGAAFPAMDVLLPYGVTSDFALPEGTVSESVEKNFALTVEHELPFEAAADVNSITTWYYAQMHGNANSTAYIQDNGEGTTNIEWADKSVDAAEIDSHLWGFAGDVWTGLKMVNKATGRAIVSTSGSAVMGDKVNATAFIPTYSYGVYNANGWFCLKYPTSNYLNASGGQVNSYGDADNGSSLKMTKYQEKTVTVVSEVGYSTLYLDYATYIPVDVEVYTVSAIENGYVTLTLVEDGVLPANTGVILKNEGEYNFVTAGATADVTSLLSGSTTDTYVAGTAYVLSKVGDVVGLYKAALNKDSEGNAVAEGEIGTHFLNNANKAYLPATGAEAPAMFSFGRGGDDAEDTTGIEQLAGDNAEVVIYDLAGRRVEKMEKGIYIVNGRKVVIR